MNREKIYKEKYGYIKYSLTENNGIEILNIFIDSKYRNKGLGTQMFLNFIKNNKYDYYYGECLYEKPLSFYKRLGFNIEQQYNNSWVVTYYN